VISWCNGREERQRAIQQKYRDVALTGILDVTVRVLELSEHDAGEGDQPEKVLKTILEWIGQSARQRGARGISSQQAL
jgi:hypothetical protein